MSQLAFANADASPTTPLSWTSPGMLLPRRKTMAWSEGVSEFDLWYDSRDVSTDFVPVTERAKVQLDEKVLLVPVHIIELSNQTTEWHKNWVGANYKQLSSTWSEAFLDNRQTSTIHSSTNPSYSPQTVNHQWAQREVDDPVRPDLIFNQCDVQFRLVKFTSCVVDPSVLAPPDEPGQCGDFVNMSMQAKVLEAVENCISEKDGGVKLIFTGRLDGGDICTEETVGITTPVPNPLETIVTANGAPKDHVISHELGHMLSLDHEFDDKERLMFEHHVNPAGMKLTETECEKVRASALLKQANWP